MKIGVSWRYVRWLLAVQAVRAWCSSRLLRPLLMARQVAANRAGLEQLFYERRRGGDGEISSVGRKGLEYPEKRKQMDGEKDEVLSQKHM